MTAYVNPPHGNDETALLNDRAHPFKTHAAAQAALDALPLEQQTGHTVVETHKVPPAAE